MALYEYMMDIIYHMVLFVTPYLSSSSIACSPIRWCFCLYCSMQKRWNMRFRCYACQFFRIFERKDTLFFRDVQEKSHFGAIFRFSQTAHLPFQHPQVVPWFFFGFSLVFNTENTLREQKTEILRIVLFLIQRINIPLYPLFRPISWKLWLLPRAWNGRIGWNDLHSSAQADHR